MMGPRLTRRRALELGIGGAVAALAPRPLAAFASPSRDRIRDLTVPLAAELRHAASGRSSTTIRLRMPEPFDLIGLSWADREPLRAELRVREAGRWEPWLPLGAAGEHAPDRAIGPNATMPVWVGGAEVVELRVSRLAEGLAASLVYTSRPPTRRRIAPRQVAPEGPAVIARAEWGAQRPRVSPSYGRVKMAFVHHTVSANAYAPEDSPEIVRSVQHYHRNVLGWDDIGYQALVDRYGQVFEGRAGGLDQAVIGAQAQGWNAVSTGVAVIGTHTDVPVTSATFEALASFLAWKLAVHGVRPKGKARVRSAGGPTCRYPEGERVRLPRISGHRHGDLTACPGEGLFAQLPELRARTKELMPADTL
jgi:hypothetical protein